MKFPDLLAAIGIAPKNLEQARAVIEPARATLDSVQALFSAAGLNLEQMLAAGPDSLKAHLASLDQSEAITELQTKLATAEAGIASLTEQLAAARSDHEVTRAALDVHASLFASLGFKPAADATPEAVKTAFAAHVEQRAATLLAHDGRPPVPHVAPAAAAEPVRTDAELLAAYEAMSPGPARTEFAAKHYDALRRADQARGN